MTLAQRIRGRSIGPALMIALLAVPVSGQEPTDRERQSDDPELRQLLLEAVARADSFHDQFDAEVWLTVMSQRLSAQVPDADERLTILRIVHQQATRAGVSPELVLSVIDVESNFDSFAISRASALGLMQIMPFWVQELDVGDGDKNVLFDVETNVLLGCQILKYYLDLENGDIVAGLARYNGSAGQRWYADRVLDRLREKWYLL